jgi:hypothetical protein
MFHASSRTKLGWAALSWLVVAILGVSPASAHHSGGAFDPNKCYVFKGTVRALAWANPHSWIYLLVPRPDGSNELWGYELGTIGTLADEGFRPSDFPRGTKVTVTAHVNRDPSKHTGSSSKLVLPNGRVIGGAAPAPGGLAAAEPASCPNY